MTIFKEIDNIDFTINGNIINVPVTDYVTGSSSDLLEYSSKSSIILENTPLFHRFTHINPDFTLIKVFKPSNTEEIAFKIGSTRVYRIVYFQVLNGVKQFDDLYQFEAIIRMKDGPDDINYESIIHEEREDAHYSDNKVVPISLLPTSFISTELVDMEYLPVSSQVINSVLITKDMQLFYLGNLIKDSDQFVGV